MRYAVSAASMASGRTRKVAEVCHFVRGCSASMFLVVVSPPPLSNGFIYFVFSQTGSR